MRVLLGLAALGGSLWLSRRRSGGLGDILPPDEVGAALKETAEAAVDLYGPQPLLPDPRKGIYDEPDYVPQCEPFSEKVASAYNEYLAAVTEGRYGANALGTLVGQYQALANLDCPGTLPEWASQPPEYVRPSP